jgi:hypothetical protein
MRDKNEDAPKPARNKGWFAKGRSGNPKGRPKKQKGEQTMSASFERVLNQPVQVRGSDRVRDVPWRDAFALQLAQESLAGDHRSRAEFFKALALAKVIKPTPPEQPECGVLVVPGMATDVAEWERRTAANQAKYRGNCGEPTPENDDEK